MIKKHLWLIFGLFTFFNLFAEKEVPAAGFSISKTEIPLGGKISFQFLIQPQGENKEYRILTEELGITSPLEVISVHYQELPKKETRVSGEITSFISGELENIRFQVPVAFSDGTVLLFVTDPQHISVAPVLTKEEEEALKKVKDPSTIELRPELPQENFRLYFETWLFLILAIVILAVLTVLIYQRVLKKMRMKSNQETQKADPLNSLSPYEKFLFLMEKHSQYADERKATETQLSDMSCALKELITRTFHFETQQNAQSETTRELLHSMRQENIDDVLVSNIGAVLHSMDMVKFAKAKIDLDVFNDYVKNIRQFGSRINEIRKERTDHENI